MRKTLSRDLAAGERNHAVVPVAEFGERFVAYFAEKLLWPLPPPPQPTLRSWGRGVLRACCAHRWPQMRLTLGGLWACGVRMWARTAKAFAAVESS